MRVRLKSATIAVMSAEEEKVVLRIPKDSVVETMSTPKDGDRMVDVQWEGKSLMMFVDDLKRHGEIEP